MQYLHVPVLYFWFNSCLHCEAQKKIRKSSLENVLRNNITFCFLKLIILYYDFKKLAHKPFIGNT